MNVGISTMAKWVNQLKQERQGKPCAAATPMTPGQRIIRELEKRFHALKWREAEPCNGICGSYVGFDGIVQFRPDLEFTCLVLFSNALKLRAVRF